MAFFDESDLQFVVFFPVDNTVHVMAKSRVEFQNDGDGSVVVMWQTSDIGDDGRMILKEMPYDGFIVFSGSLQKCRGYEKKIQEEILEKNNGKETSALVNEMRNLSEEMRKSGKRGSSLKLKRVLEEEKDESNKKAKKSNKSKPTSKPVHQSKPSASRKLSELKLKELEAFAGIQSQQKSPAKPLSQKTPSKSLQKTPSKKTPSKSLQKTPSKSPQKTPSKSLQKSPVKSLPQKLPSKSLQKLPVNSLPQKTPSKSLQKTPSKSLQKTPSKSPQKSPSKSLQKSLVKSLPQKSPSKSLQKTPCKSLQKSQLRSLSKSPLQKSPSKSPLQNSPSKLLLQNSPFKSLPQKFPSNLPQKSSSKSLQKSPSKSFHNKMPKSPRKTPVMKEYQESTSFIIGQGLGILNDDENFHDHIDSAMEFEDMPDPSFHEYGYNAGMHVQTETNQGQSDFNLAAPVENLIGYYRGLSFEQQSGILSFLHMLTNTLQNSSQISASGSTSIPVHTASYTPNFETPGSSSQTIDQETPSAKELRKLPLINDENNTYSDVLVNPSQLRTAEMKSLTATKNGSIYLLNKIVEMVFTRDELRASKGVRGLDKHKLEAVQEYMHTKCRKLQLDPILPKTFNKTIQNKIGNLRHETKGKATLV